MKCHSHPISCFRNLNEHSFAYDCLAAGIKLITLPEKREIDGWISDAPLEPTPKSIIKTISKDPKFASILLNKLLPDAVEGNRLKGKSYCLWRFFGVILSYSHSYTSFLECFTSRLLALADEAPKMVCKKLSVLYLLTAYRGTLSPAGKLTF